MDGSFIDGPSVVTGRAGFAIAVVDENGHLLACANGAPPAWVRDSAGAEAWALLTVLHLCPAMPYLFTDCLGLISTLARGKMAATSHDRPHARLWGLIFAALDGGTQLASLHSSFVWIPAHRSRQAVGHALRSDGLPLTLENWRANRLVDLLAKAAAERFRVPARTRSLLSDAAAAVHFSAALLGVVTHAANNFAETSWRGDGSAVVVKHRDALPLPYDDHRRHQAMRRADAPPRTTSDAPKPEKKLPTTTAHETPSASSSAAAPLDHAHSQATALRQKQQEAQQRGLQAWLQDLARRDLRPAADAGLAQQRLAALRARIAAKQ